MAHSTTGLYGLGTVDQYSQAVIRKVCRRDRMARSPCDSDGHLGRGLTCSGMRRDRCTLGDASPDLASGPSSACLDGLARPNVPAMTLEQRQKVFRAVSSPGGKDAVIGQRQRTATMSSDKSLVTHSTPSCRQTVEINGSRPHDYP